MKNSKITKELVAFILMLVMYEDVFTITPDNSNYNYETEEHELLDGEDRLLEERYTDIEDSYRNCDDPYSVLEWRPVSEVIG